MSKGEYRGVIVGLTGIGARRPPEEENLPVYGAMPTSHASAYYRCPQTELVGVCDLREEALADFKANWGDVWPKMHYYTDYREMLETEKPDLLSVATLRTTSMRISWWRRWKAVCLRFCVKSRLRPRWRMRTG